jgi:hypothetical protein
VSQMRDEIKAKDAELAKLKPDHRPSFWSEPKQVRRSPPAACNRRAWRPFDPRGRADGGQRAPHVRRPEAEGAGEGRAAGGGARHHQGAHRGAAGGAAPEAPRHRHPTLLVADASCACRKRRRLPRAILAPTWCARRAATVLSRLRRSPRRRSATATRLSRKRCAASARCARAGGMR